MRQKSTDYVITREEALKVLENIRSLREQGITRRIQSPRVRIFCALCGKERIMMMYDFRKAVLRGYSNLFCSKRCAEESEHIKGIQKHKCQMCGKLCAKGVKYCSDCLNIARRKSKGGIQPIEKTCSICGNVFLARHCGHGTFATYCSKDCKNKAQSNMMSGEGNVKYKNWITIARDKNSVKREFYRTKQLVKKREQTCVLCGTSEHLEHHHIDLNPLNNSLENVVRICSECHKECHRQEMSGIYMQAKYKELRDYILKH